MKILIATNPNHTGKYPAGWADMSQLSRDTWWRKFNGQFCNVALSVDDLAASIQSGYAYTAQHHSYRRAANFTAAQHLALDFDNGATLAELAADPFILAHAAIIHTTPSHTPENPRARVVFILDRPITNAKKYTELSEALVWRFKTADQSCKDAARFYFGAPGCELVTLPNILTLETAAAELVFPHRAAMADQRPVIDNRQIITAADVPAELLRAHRDRLLWRVESAPDGEKYYTLRNIAYTFGGYVAGGYYDHTQAVDWLGAAIRSNKNSVKSLSAADKTIAAAVAAGKAKTLHFELRDNQPTPETDPQTAPAPAADRTWREEARQEYLAQLETLLREIDASDPAWLPAAQKYQKLAAVAGG